MPPDEDCRSRWPQPVDNIGSNAGMLVQAQQSMQQPGYTGLMYYAVTTGILPCNQAVSPVHWPEGTACQAR